MARFLKTWNIWCCTDIRHGLSFKIFHLRLLWTAFIRSFLLVWTRTLVLYTTSSDSGVSCQAVDWFLVTGACRGYSHINISYNLLYRVGKSHFLGIPALCFLLPYNEYWLVINLTGAPSLLIAASQTTPGAPAPVPADLCEYYGPWAEESRKISEIINALRKGQNQFKVFLIRIGYKKYQ